VGWRHLNPVCERCAAGRPVLRMTEFAARLGGPVLVEPAPAVVADGSASVVGSAAGPPPDADSRIAESPIAVLTAEIALLHARLDDLQARFEQGR
jgi:hypothetical protein